MIEHKRIKGLSFDDILIPPVYSTIRSRSEPDTTTKVGPLTLKIPFISSPMDTVTESKMAIEMGKLGGLGIIHRFMDPEAQAIQCDDVLEAGQYVVPAIGVGESERKRLDCLMNNVARIDMVSIDVANGHSILMEEMVAWVKQNYPNLPIMAGNIATFHGYEFMIGLGVDAVRVGIGGGSICKTRIQSSVGIPTLSSVVDCARARHKFKYYNKNNPNMKFPSIIADGGIRYPSDVVKSIIGGADAVMCGGVFAGTDESPSELIYLNEVPHKKYRGMASASVQKDRRGGLKEGTCSEGVTTYIPYTGSLHSVLHGDDGFVGGLKSGMSYLNTRTIKELQEFDTYITITPASLNESHAYGTKK
jgi:IMP dehydrogenase